MRLKQLRLENKLRQADVAKLLNVTPEAYSMWETGVRQAGVSNLVVLARYYNVSLEYLVGVSDTRHITDNLSADEEMLLQWYSQLDATDRGLLSLLARSLAAGKKYGDGN